MKKCPYCGEEILEEAIKCKHCGSMMGIKISNVFYNSVASNIGLKEGDVLLSIDDNVIKSSNGLDRFEEKMDLGRRFEIKIKRDKELLVFVTSFTRKKRLGIIVSEDKTTSNSSQNSQGMSGAGLFFLIVGAIIFAVIIMSLGL